MYIFEFQNLFSWVVWNPNRVFFTIPYINHPIVWYGVLFALGFLAAYTLGARIFLREIASRSPLTPEEIIDEKKLLTLCQKYPKLFPENQLSLTAILPLLDKYIKAKILPYAFFHPQILKTRKKAMEIADRLTTYLMIGLVVGARLGYVFFYGWPAFKGRPLEIIKIWEGGLSSHGACLGMIVGLALFVYRQSKEKLKITFLQGLDILAIISGTLAFFIRMGNFMNQEILGIPTNVSWAIIFGDPLAGESMVPRHPVQLYEALFYLFMAMSTYLLWKKNWAKVGEGVLTGILLVNLFSFRFMVEFIKVHQGLVIDAQSALQMGQVLSIPFVLLGLALILRPILGKQLRKKPLS